MSVGLSSSEMKIEGLQTPAPESKKLSFVEIPVTRGKSERRRAPRFTFVAAAFLVELKSRTELRARTTDLSLTGCYVDTMNTFPVNTEVTINITHESESFVALGRVAYSQSNMGMGIGFVKAEPDQLKTLRKWLSELSRATK